jgi:hypothetical protein
MYKVINDETVLRLSDNSFIPADKGNRDYLAYLEWLAQGNVPEAADEKV